MNLSTTTLNKKDFYKAAQEKMLSSFQISLI
nr:MAG TPA: hypothetical protein [Caudoviricetes sp.]